MLATKLCELFNNEFESIKKQFKVGRQFWMYGERMSAKKTFAKDLKCCVCGRQAEVFWPVFDPDIPSYPYCRECVTKEQTELLTKLNEIDKKHERD